MIGKKRDLIYQKLTPPDVYLEDGQTRLDNNTSIAAEDRVILKAEGQKTGKWVYYLSDSSRSDFDGVKWEDWEGAISITNKFYLYVRKMP